MPLTEASGRRRKLLSVLTRGPQCNELVHKVNIATSADGRAGIAHVYVSLAIQAPVREAVQAAPRVGQAGS